MGKKKKLLKDMELNSVDLCSEGMNPKADIKLYKSRDAGGEDTRLQKRLKRLSQLFLEAENRLRKSRWNI